MDAPESALRPFPGSLRLQKLNIETPLENGEEISTVATHKSNIYLGTSKGQILHLHLFEDASEYMLILQLQVTEKDVPVTKILPLPDVELCLVICNRTLYVYTLPELSPCHIGKMRDVNDVSELSQVKNPKTKNIHDKAIVFTSSKLRVVQFTPPETIKLLRDIPYNGALLGVSSAAGTSANYSNICLVANGDNYDVVDMKQTRRISLFEHNPEKEPGIRPFILPFHADGKEEFLLPVRANESTAMAMFINSFGDVTRGTLTWLDTGYPTHGMAVTWPFVLGISEKEESLLLTFSSLETLEVVASVQLADTFKSLELGEPKRLRVQNIQEPIHFPHSGLSELLRKVDIDGSGEPYTSLQPADVILYNENSVHYMYQESQTYLKLSKVTEALGNEEMAVEDLLKELEGEPGVLRVLHTILLLVDGQLEEFKESSKVDFDPRIFLYLTEDLENELYKGLQLESVVWTVLNHYRKLELDPSFISSYHDFAYENSTVDSAVFDVLRSLIYARTKDTKLLIELIDRESDLWQSDHRSNQVVVDQLQSREQYLAQTHILVIQQNSEKSAAQINDMAHKLTHIAFRLLDGKDKQPGIQISPEGVATVDEASIDLVDLITTQLKDKMANSDLYNRTLLELLKLYPDRGISFLEANKNGKHRATHKHILEEFSKLHGDRAGFSSLKLEFIEQSLADSIRDTKHIDLEVVSELVEEQIQYLSSQKDDMAKEYASLDEVLTNFNKDHNLSNRRIPSIKWIDYLHVHGPKSECKSLASIYLKIYELILVLSLYDKKVLLPDPHSNHAMQYLNLMFTNTSADEIIEGSLELGDHLNAHWFAVYEKPPLLKKMIYFSAFSNELDSLYSKRPPNEIKISIQSILESYLLYKEALSRYEGVKHLVLHYGKEYFEPTEVLRLLPSDMPIAFVFQYLSDVLIDNDIRVINSDMTKILTRLDMNLNKKVYGEFHEAFQDHLEEADDKK